MSKEFTSEQKKQVQEQVEDAWFTSEARVMAMMKEHFGEEAYQVYRKSLGDHVRNRWSKIAEEAGDNSIEMFLKRQWQPSGENSEYTIEETESGFRFNVTKCRMADLAKRLGITEHMFYLCCEPDLIAAEGFNLNIGFERSKTLMQGDDCCDHFYFYKDKSKQS